MKLKLIILNLLLLCVFSCYDVEKPAKPDHFLSEEEMTSVLIDLSIISAAKGIDKRKLEEVHIMPRDFVFKKHNIDSVIFAQNNNYYAYRPDIYTKIYQKVTDSLKVLKTIAENNSIQKSDKTSILKKAELKSLKDSLPKFPKKIGLKKH